MIKFQPQLILFLQQKIELQFNKLVLSKVNIIPKIDQTVMLNGNGLFGLFSGIITTSILQPFENVKMALMIPPNDLKQGTNVIRNLYNASQYIYKTDGIKGFYKGFFASNMKAGLGCYIYFAILRHKGKESKTSFQDFVLSSIARIISTFLTNPLNIIQTRYQLANFHQYKSIRGAMVSLYQREGYMGFFSGAMTSCCKEGIFGGFYYMLYEKIKQLGVNKFAAGITSGMIATAITHPFEIIRARIQTGGLVECHSVNQHLIVKEIKVFVRHGGYFKGLAPRLMKKPLYNTLTFYLFEFIEERKQDV